MNKAIHRAAEILSNLLFEIDDKRSQAAFESCIIKEMATASVGSHIFVIHWTNEELTALYSYFTRGRCPNPLPDRVQFRIEVTDLTGKSRLTILKGRNAQPEYEFFDAVV